ncbi:hypothetical protein SLS63_007848 [Diaporthe eres]|uniref:Uncharacterized protein n=1 Tax=Diaporthe eres TaxID=83184 RepID=A0ABR1P410_DIAER
MLKLEQKINADVLSETQRSHLFDQAATQLSDPDQVLSLAQHDGFTGSQAENAANYNSFQIDLDNGTYSAVFPRVSKFSELAEEYHQLDHYNTKASLKALQVLEKAMKINRKEPMLTSATPLLIQAAWTAYRGGHVGMAKRYVEEIEEDMKARGFDDEWEESSLKDIKKLLY